MMTGKQITTLMRKNHMTIRGLAKTTGFTMKRIREVRSAGLACPYAVRDWVEAITGTDPGASAEWLAKRDGYSDRPVAQVDRRLFQGIPSDWKKS
jgi:hypothetical protein